MMILKFEVAGSIRAGQKSELNWQNEKKRKLQPLNLKLRVLTFLPSSGIHPPIMRHIFSFLLESAAMLFIIPFTCTLSIICILACE
jgi:hypothetical protein